MKKTLNKTTALAAGVCLTITFTVVSATPVAALKNTSSQQDKALDSIEVLPEEILEAIEAPAPEPTEEFHIDADSFIHPGCYESEQSMALEGIEREAFHLTCKTLNQYLMPVPKPTTEALAQTFTASFLGSLGTSPNETFQALIPAGSYSFQSIQYGPALEAMSLQLTADEAPVVVNMHLSYEDDLLKISGLSHQATLD